MNSHEITSDPRLRQQVSQHPYPLVFATISGAHLYGFPSANSDFDLRGTHVLPLNQVVGLKQNDETVEKSGIVDSLEIDLVTHDISKFIGLMLKRNGYVLEQLLSPLIVHTTDEHAELKSLAPGCITRHHAHHYLGFALTQWRLFEKESPPRVKPLLYVYRVLLTGIHLMRTGQIEANLITLNDTARLTYIPELVARKVSGVEKECIADADMDFFRSEYQRLLSELETAYQQSRLPENSSSFEGLDALLIRIRTRAQ